MFLVLALFCTFVEAVFTALEVATNASSRTRLRALAAEFDDAARASTDTKTSENRALQTLKLLENPARLALLFLTVTSLTMWTAAISVVWQSALSGWNLATQIALLVGLLFVAEVLPLLIAARRTETVAMRGARVLSGAIRVLDPLIFPLECAGKWGVRGLGAAPNSVGVTSTELRTALATAEEEGVLESDERALLEGAMDFREKSVRDVMTPHSEIVAVREQDSLLETLQTAMRESHSRLPVLDENARIVGIVAAKDLIAHAEEIFAPASAKRHCARDILRAPLWVEENAPVAAVLEELRRQRSLMAIVKNAGNEAVGLVTLEDLLEEIVGEIQDEYDDEEPPLRIESDESHRDESHRDESHRDESHRDESHRDAAAKNAFQNATGPFEQTEIGESENRPVDFSTRASEAVEGQIRQDEISEDEKCERVASASQAENFTARAGEMMLSQARSRRVLCEADVKVRELQRFWREKFGENARLQLRGEDVASSLSLREFATQLFASDSDSENVQTKETPKTLEIQTDETTKNAASANVANANTDNANVANVDVANAEIVDANIIDAHVADVSAEILEARVVCGARVRAGFSVAIADAKAGDEKPLQLEIVAMNGARIEKVRLCGSEIDA